MGGRQRRRGAGTGGVLAAAALVVLVAALLPRGAGGTVVSGTVDTSDCYSFVSRYTFYGTSSSYTGYFHLNLSYPANTTNLAWVLFFSDETTSWAKVSEGGLTCQELRASAGSNVFTFPVHRNVYFPNGERYSTSYKVLRFTNSYTRTFYLGLVNTDPFCGGAGNCDGPLLNTSYAGIFSQQVRVAPVTIGGSATSDTPTEVVVNQASYDEAMLLAFYAVAAGLSIGVTVWSSVVAHKLFADDKFHRVFQVLLLSVQSCCLGMVCQLVHRALLQTGVHYDNEAYADMVPIMSLEERMDAEGLPSRFDDMSQMLPPGKGVPWLDQDSQYLFLFSEWLLVMQIMLIGKGWAIVRRKLPPQGRFRLVLGMLIFLYARILLTAWLFNTFDPERDVWFFNAGACGLVLGLNLVMLVWFIVSVNHTKNKFLRKRRFFNKYLALVTLYMLGVPVAQLVCQLSLDDYLLRQVYAIIQGCSLLLAHIVHLGLYHPDTKCNKGFPFHADVKQMDWHHNKRGSGGDDDLGGATVSLAGVAADGEVVEKIVRLKSDDFQALTLYSVRIQERLLRLARALEACAAEYDDISFVDEDNMTVLELQSEKDALRDDLTHGLFRTHKFSDGPTTEARGVSSTLRDDLTAGLFAGRKVPAGSSTRLTFGRDQHNAAAGRGDAEEELGAVPVAEEGKDALPGKADKATTAAAAAAAAVAVDATADSGGQSRGGAAAGGTVDLLTGHFVRKRANALDTAAPQERSDLRKMKRATKEGGGGGGGGGSRHTRHQVADSKAGGDDDDDDDDEIVRRPSPKQKAPTAAAAASTSAPAQAAKTSGQASPSRSERRRSKKSKKKDKKSRRKSRVIEDEDDDDDA